MRRRLAGVFIYLFTYIISLSSPASAVVYHTTTGTKVMAIIRLGSFGFRCLAFRAKGWMRADENKPPPQVILLMPTGDGTYRPASQFYADLQTKNLIDRIQRDSFELFNDYSSSESAPPLPRKKPPKLAEIRGAR